MDVKIIETIIIVFIFLVARITISMAIHRIQARYNYSKYRIRPIIKFSNLFILLTSAIILIGIWGIEQKLLLTFITSVLTVIGIALFAQWSILSNITSALIIFISHPVKLEDTITILDKDYDIHGKLTEVGLIYVTIKTETGEKVFIPNNIFIQKMTKLL